MKKPKHPVDWFGIVIVTSFIATLMVLFHVSSAEHPVGEWQCINWTESNKIVSVSENCSKSGRITEDGWEELTCVPIKAITEKERTCNLEVYAREPE